jgi:hypothetical protein
MHAGRFVMGSNKVLQVALGKTEADEYRTNIHYLSGLLKGAVGLFFTSLPKDEVSGAAPPSPSVHPRRHASRCCNASNHHP